MEANLLELWRRHFILEDNLYEIGATCLTPQVVLQTSGHVERFKDFMVADCLDGTCHRADHLLEDRLDALLAQNEADPKLSEDTVLQMKKDRARADDMTLEELEAALLKYDVKSPDTGNDLKPPFPFNLMFQTSIGPTGKDVGFMRPELAQGIFVNFARLLEQNGGRMPFGGACIGRAFRNEISPRQGLLRVREFTLAEIEFFVHPEKKNFHERFCEVQHVRLNLWPRRHQEDADHSYFSMSIGDAVKEGIVANQTLGYYLARVHMFLVKAGALPQYLRFRQHLSNEMAHYASDCWDAELLTSYGWVECVGNADRAAYDLTVHMNKTGVRLACWDQFETPQVVEAMVAQPVKAEIGKVFRTQATELFAYLAGLDEGGVMALQSQFKAGGGAAVPLTLADEQEIMLDHTMVKFELQMKKISGKWIIPSVIEPSFGVGRIMYALLEHSFYARAGDTHREVLRLSPLIAPIKCSVLPLMVKEALLPKTKEIASLLTRHGISAKVDLSGTTIGRRYSRTDEIGIPYGITVDYETVENPGAPFYNTVTLRDRDSMEQVRVPIRDLPRILNNLVALDLAWSELALIYPAQASTSS
jgi:glycyl-tRNA synthetase